MDAARAPLKALRDAETNIIPRRNIRAGLKLELSRVEHAQQKGAERKIAELKEQIRKADLDDEPQEKEIELLKRKAIRESEQLKWEAFREVRALSIGKDFVTHQHVSTARSSFSYRKPRSL